MSRARDRLPELDLLRGIAALSVVLYHTLLTLQLHDSIAHRLLNALPTHPRRGVMLTMIVVLRGWFTARPDQRVCPEANTRRTSMSRSWLFGGEQGGHPTPDESELRIGADGHRTIDPALWAAALPLPLDRRAGSGGSRCKRSAGDCDRVVRHRLAVGSDPGRNVPGHCLFRTALPGRRGAVFGSLATLAAERRAPRGPRQRRDPMRNPAAEPGPRRQTRTARVTWLSPPASSAMLAPNHPRGRKHAWTRPSCPRRAWPR